MNKCCICDTELKTGIDHFGHVLLPLCLNHWFSHGEKIDLILKSGELYRNPREIYERIEELKSGKSAKENTEENTILDTIKDLEGEMDNVDLEIDDLENEKYSLSLEINSLRKRLDDIKINKESMVEVAS